MVRICKRKWSIVTKQCTEAFSWAVEVLGSDQYGTWLGSTHGNPVLQPDGRVELQQHDLVWLIAKDAWFLPAFWYTADTDLTIDVCTPPAFADGTWSFVDMELDLYRRSDGHAGIVDQDEWEVLVGSGLVSDDVVRSVEGTATTLLKLVERKIEPFGQVPQTWLSSLDPAGGPQE